MRPSALAFLLTAAVALAETPEEIMAKVAANMANGAAARRLFVYQQRVKATITQSNGTLNRREDRTYLVIPQEKTTEKKLEHFAGEYREGKKMIPYDKPHNHGEDHDQDGKENIGKGIDAEIVAEMTDGLVNDKKAPDGIPRDLFPLRSDVLAGYHFKSLGEKTVNGRRALRIGFEPAEKKGVCIHIGSENEDEGVHADLGKSPEPGEQPIPCQPWEGEALIDAEEFFPVRIDTKLARGIPWAVRAFLGTNIQQLGFSITYTRATAPDGSAAWFPSTYGTEFKLSVLFLYKRTIALSLESSDFRRAETSSTIQFEQQ